MSDSPERVQGINQIVECDICMRQYDHEQHRPKTLSCGHTFCLRCVDVLHSEGSCSCPICRKITKVTSVSDLPTNFDTLSTLDSLCAQCQVQPGCGQCQRCTQSLCQSCLSKHNAKFSNSLSTKLELLRDYVEDLDKSCRSLHDDDKQLDRIIEKIEDAFKEKLKALKKEKQQRINEIKKIQEKHLANQQIWQNIGRFHVKSNTEFLNKSCLMTNVEVVEEECDNNTEGIRNMYKTKPKPSDAQFISNLSDNKLGELKFTTADPERKHIFWGNFNSVRQLKFVKRLLVPNLHGVESLRPIQSGGISISPKGDIVVSDYYNHIIYSIGKNSEIKSFGGMGYQDAEFLYPFDVAISCESDLYVSDELNNRIQVLDSSGKFLRTLKFKDPFSNKSVRPKGLTFDGRDVLYICDAAHSSVVLALKNGDILTTVGRDVLTKAHPSYITVTANNNIAVTDELGNVFVMTNSGQLVSSVLGNATNSVSHSRAVASNTYGEIFLTSKSEDLVVINESGEHIKTFNKLELSKGRTLEEIRGITFSKEGNLHVCDQKYGIVEFAVYRYSDTFLLFILVISILSAFVLGLYIKLFA